MFELIAIGTIIAVVYNLFVTPETDDESDTSPEVRQPEPETERLLWSQQANEEDHVREGSCLLTGLDQEVGEGWD